jgi:hypothetical protein
MVESKSGSISNNINTYSEFQRESAARDINYIAAGVIRPAILPPDGSNLQAD